MPLLLVLLLLVASGPVQYASAVIFAGSLALLYAASGAYHVFAWGTRLEGFAWRLDQAAIYAVIGGTYTPFCLLALPPAWGIPMLALIWILCGVAATTRVAWTRSPRWLGVVFGLGLGWLALVAAWPMAITTSIWVVLGLGLGGLAYSAGAAAYAARWPNPWPRWFGHHEVFHTAVLGGTCIHSGIVVALLAGAL